MIHRLCCLLLLVACVALNPGAAVTATRPSIIGQSLGDRTLNGLGSPFYDGRAGHVERTSKSVHPATIRRRASGDAPPSNTGPARPNILFIYTDDQSNLPDVKRGDIRKLLILESLPKPVNFSGGQDLTSWLGTFTLERVLGTVPVEEDGSAYFEVPADRQLLSSTTTPINSERQHRQSEG